VTTPDEIREAIRVAEADLQRVRRRMEEAADDGGGALSPELAGDFEAHLARINSRIWSLKAKLRTPLP
jgi:hypothetical protein